jgi:hypothetical protein
MLSHNFSIFYLAAALLAAAGFFLSSDGAQRASLIQRGRTRAVALALGAGLLALLGFAADVVLWREWRKPMNYLARFYFDPNGRRSALAFAAKGLGEEAALFAPFGFAGGALAIVMLVAAVLLLADGVRSRRRRDPGPAGRFLAPATFAALTFLLVAASLLGRYPLGGELRHQSIVLPFAILTVVAGVDRGVQAFHGTAPKIAAWLSAFALVGANAAYQTAHFSYQAVGPREATAAFLEAGPPVPRDLYADQFSFIPLFAAYSDCGWRALGPVPGSEGALRYGVECPTGNFDVYRDSARWNLHLEEPQARARLDNLLDATTLRCLTCFHIDQKGAARGARAETEASVRLLDARNIREKAPFRIFEVCRQGKP